MNRYQACLVVAAALIACGSVALAQSPSSIAYAYDSLNRLTEIHYPDRIVHYTYDAAGNRLTMTVDLVCAFGLSSSAATYPASGGTGSVDVTVQNGCAWTAVSNDAFITVTGGASGTGNGAVSYSVAPGGAARLGTLTIATKSFTVTQTAPTAPIIVTGAASGIGAFAATLNGTANPNGLATNANFEYGLTTAYGMTTAAQALAAGGIAMPIGGGTISGLMCNTQYHFRATGMNAIGAINGLDGTLTTATCPAPVVTTGSASAISAVGVTLNGTANPNGTAATGRFEYGLTPAYGGTTPVQTLGSVTADVAIGGGAIVGLTCNTLYHFRAIATNPTDTTLGSDATFKTLTTVGCAFTDDPLTAGSTVIKALHVTELRIRIDALRARFGLAAFNWTDVDLQPGALSMKAQHISDLRLALSEVYGAAARTAPTYTDPNAEVGMAIKAIHIVEIRTAIVAIE